VSESWGADYIPPQASGRLNLVEALSVAQHLPAEALESALRRNQVPSEAVLSLLDRAAAGDALSARERNLLFWGIHLLGTAREARLFAPLLRLFRLPAETVGELIGDAVGTTLPRILAGAFDGDVAALETALLDRGIDEYLRWSLFGALSFLTFAGRVPRERAEALLLRFDEERAARAGDAAWTGWEETIALLGLRSLRPRVEAARAEARLLDDVSDPAWFEEILAVAEAAPDGATRFREHGLGYIEDLVAELDEALASDEESEPGEPLRNPLREVGRNDPCPCGSGKKFKKCCLGKAGERT
jgi:uncharacterized protein